MARRKRILCVDDHEDVCYLIAAVLKEYEVIPAYTKAEGLLKASAEHFDMYLLDYYLSDGTGLELYFSIRHFDATTPAFFVTNSEAILNEQAKEWGAEGVIEKHQLTDELPLAVSRVLASH